MPTTRAASPTIFHVYIGTQTRTTSKGIYLLHFDAATGVLTAEGLAAEVSMPGFLAIAPDQKHLYSVGDMPDPSDPVKRIGAVDAFSIDPRSGKLTLLNQQPSGGAGPCFVGIDPAGHTALVANYGSGHVASLPIHPDGTLAPAATIILHAGAPGPNANRQKGPHAHSINPDPTGRRAYAADLGLDKIFIYHLDPKTSVLTPNDPPFAIAPPGGGPRHLAWHPSAPIAYVCNEMGGTVTTYVLDASTGALRELQTVSTLPRPVTPADTTAEVQVHPGGRFLYVSNRGHDSLALFEIDPKTHTLTPNGHFPSGGKVPRNFRIDPTGQFLICANQNSDNVVLFRINQDTGALKELQTIPNIPTPICVKFLAIPNEK